MMKRVVVESLKEKVEKELKSYIERTEDNKLPTEDHLAITLGVSRQTIREALSSLTQKGYIAKRKGKGNYILKSVIKTKMRVDLSQDFATIIANLGLEPSQKRTFIQERSGNEELAQRLDLNPKEPLLDFRWDYYADDKLAIQGFVSIPKKLFTEVPEDNIVYGKENVKIDSLYTKHCNQDVTHNIIKVSATIDSKISQAFNLDPRTIIMCWDETFYNYLDQPIGVCDIYFNPDVLQMSMVSTHEQIYL
jgi:DNA-binding GntR family transcriptional regulator